MASTVITFSRLPYELREMIWLNCIPSRVIELEVPPVNRLSSHTETCTFWTAHQNTRPPVVTRVCRESREITLKVCGRRINDKKCPDWDLYLTTEMPFFNPARDIITWSSLNCILPYGPKVREKDSYFICLAKAAQDILVPAQTFYPFRYLMLPMESTRLHPKLEWAQLDSLANLKDFMVCIKVVQMHMPASKALNSSISGKTGDGLIQLVDPSDTAMIKLFDQSDPNDADLKIVFKRMLDKETMDREIKLWMTHVANHWVFRCFSNLPNRSEEQRTVDHDAGMPYRSTLQPFTEESGKENPAKLVDRWSPLWGCYRPSPVAEEVLELECPWVQWVLERIPRMRPMIMFRYCVSNCAALKSTESLRAIHSGRYPPKHRYEVLVPEYQELRKRERGEEIERSKEDRRIVRRI